ncbi:acyl-CoA dehydrogenase family protein [Frankia sp. CiP1_Cm_nod2]|uniref:acyl-CoA dehydrogenase family protein n=3 Tax=unclassified Frankia TaxID=2632575 RepID=UPI002025463E
MRWDLADEQEMFRDSLGEWLDRFAPADTVHGWLGAGDAATFEGLLVSDGWLAVGFAQEYGGQGGGLLELALTAERLGRHSAPSSAWTASVLAVEALTVLPERAAAVLTDGSFAALAVDADRPPDEPGPVVEVGAGRAGLDGGDGGDGGVLRGTVRSVLGADRARQLIVPAGTAAGRALFLVDAGTEGVGIRARELLDRSRSVADVDLADVPARRLGADAERVLAQAALRAAVLVAADSLGAAERMLRLAVEYSKQRRQFGVPIGSFQAVKHAAASILVAVEAARSVVYFAAVSVDQGHEDAALHAATAKAQVTAAGEQAADSALTMHGAIGYTWEHELQLAYKRAKLNKRLFGAPGVWNERLAAALPLLPVA